MGFPKKISQLPSSVSVKLTDLFVTVNDSDITTKATIGQLINLVSGSTNTYVTGGTYNDITKNIDFDGNSGFPPFSVNLSGISTTDTFVTGATLNGLTLEIDRNNGEPQITVDLSSLTGDTDTNTFVTGTTLVGTNYTINQNNGTSFTTDFNPIVSGKVDTTIFDTYTADTQTEINSKLDITTFDTYTANTVDNNTFITGTTLVGTNYTINENNGSSFTTDFNSIVSGFTTGNTFVTGFTYNDDNTLTISRNDGVDLSASINTMTGLTVNGNLLLPDGNVSNNYIGLGDAEDLKIFHNGSHSIIRETGTGSLYLQSDDSVILSKDSGTELMVRGIADGSVELYYDNVKKLETSIDGVVLSGDLITGDNRLTYAPTSAGIVSFLDFTVTQFGQNNNTVLSSVKSINLFLDSNGGDSGQAFRIYNNASPDSPPLENTYIFKVDESGDVLIKGNLSLLQTPTLNNSGTDILIRNNVTGEVEYRPVSGITTTDNNTFVTGGTYNSGTTSLDFAGNSGFTPFSVNVQSLISPFEVTGTQGAVQPKDSSYTNTTQGTVWLGGTVSKIAGDYNFIGNGINHNIEAAADYSFIGNGNNNHLGDGVNQVAYSAILAGKDNTIEGTVFNSAIIAGENNTITHNNTFILGSNINSSQANTTYVENLNIGDIGSAPSVINLGLDTNGNVVTGVTAIDTNTFVTGATLTNDILDIERNDGVGISVDLSSIDTNIFVNSGNADVALQQLTFTNTSGGTFNVTNAAALFTDNDINVTGGTYDNNTGCVTFVTNSGTSFDICGFITGLTDTYIDNASLVGTTYTLNRTDGATIPTDFNPIVSGKLDTDIFNTYTANTTDNVVTGATLNGTILELERNNGLTDVTVDLSSLTGAVDTNTFVTGATLTNTTLDITRNDGVNIPVNLGSLTFTGNTSGTCINELWVSNISGCSPVTIGTELVVNDDTSINGHLTVTSSGSNTSDTVFLVQDSLGNHIIEALDTGVVHVGDDTVNSPLPTNPTLIIGAGKTPNDRGSLAFTSTGIGIGGDNDGTNDFLLFRLSTNQDSQWRFYNTSSFGWILNDRKSNSFGSQSGLRTTISTARSYGMDFMLDQNDAGVSDTCGFRFSSKDNTIAGANDVERFVIENGASETKSYFDNISVLGVGTSNPDTNVRLHISGDTLINGGLSADTITLSEDPTLNNSGTDILVRNSSSGNVEYREITSLTANTFVTGGTLENGVLSLDRNDGVEVNISGFSSGNTIYTTTTNFSAGIPQTITHNLNTPNVIVQTIDTNTSELINGTISNYTNNTLDVTLSSSLNNIKTIVIGNSNSTIINPLFSWNDPVVQSGNTSGTCIDQLFVHSISGCSPVLIGDTQFTNEVTYSPQTIVDLPTYILTDCTNSLNIITTTQNLREYIGKTITLASEGATKWSVELQPQLEVTSVSDCCFINWDVRDCDTGERWNVVTYKWDASGYTASTITLEEQEGCFTVSGTCEDPTLFVPINVIESFESCELCNTSLYQIFNCDGLLLGVTDEDLSAFDGGTWTGSTNPLLIEECFTIESGGEEVTIDGAIVTNPLIEIDCVECTSEPTLYTLFTCEGEEIGVTAQDLSSVEGGTYSGTTNPILSGICFTIEGGGEEVTFEDTIDTEELVEKDCEECVTEEGTTLTIDGESQPTNADFAAAPYDGNSPGEGWSWILITYSEEGPIGQDVNTVFTTEGFFEGNFPAGLIVISEALGVYIPNSGGFNSIGNFIPGESYQVNIDTNSIINSGSAGLEGFFTF